MINWRKMGEGLGIIEVDSQPQVPTEAAPAAPAATAPAMQTVAPSAVLTGIPSVAPVTNDVPSVLDTAHVESAIVELIETNPAFLVYRTFNDAMSAIAQHIPDERTRYTVAGATTKFTFAELQPSLETWKGVVEAEDANFKASFIAEKQSSIQMLDAQLSGAEAEIAELTRKLGELAEQRNKLAGEKVQREGELAKANIDFETVVKNISFRYTTIGAKLTQYMGGANV